MLPPPNQVLTKLKSSPTARHWFLVLLVGLAACLPLFLNGAPFAGDLRHHYRTVFGFYDAILSGNFYPSWHASANGGYGDPSVRFYPPAIYFLMCGFRLITPDWFSASIITSTLLTVAGSCGMYLWARSFTTHYYALAAGLIYVLSPFHANEMYQAGMYAQYAAGNVLPFVFAFLERIIQGGRSRAVAGLGFTYGLLILFNVPFAVLGSIALGIYGLIRLIQVFHTTSVFRLVAGVFLGVALSCFYWLPVMREIKWKAPSGIGQGAWYDYRNNFLFHHSPSDMSNFLLPFLVAGTIAIAAPTLVLVFKKESKVLAPAVVALFAFFMATPLSKPIWDQFPVLQETQFPWRWMTIVSACLSLLVSVSLREFISRWHSRWWQPLILSSVGLVVIALSFTILQLIRDAPLFHRVPFNEQVESQKGSPTYQDFLPVWARVDARPMSSEVEAGSRSVTITEWQAERKLFSLAAGPETEARLKIFYYPYWVATSAGQILSTRPADDGALLLTVPTNNSAIEVRFVEPLSSSIAGTVSICALLVIILLFATQRSSATVMTEAHCAE